MATKSERQQISKWFFLLIALAVGIVFWKIVQPFIVVLLTATIAAIILSPLEKKLQRLVKFPKLSALLMVCGVLLVIVLPLFLLGIVMIQEAQDVIDASIGADGLLRKFDPTSHPVTALIPKFAVDYIASLNLDVLTKNIGEWAIRNVGDIFSSTARLLLNIFIFFISLYYILVDREKIKREVELLSPFKDSLDDKIMRRIISTVRGVVFGALIVAFVQGILAAIGMAFAGVPGALIWGALTVIAAQVPFVGVGLVLIPAIGYLLLTGEINAAIFLTAWSVIFVGLADNFLAPQLMKGQTHMHALLLLIAILGGLHAFGSIGVIIGPTILAAVMVVLELYKNGILEKGSISIK